MGESIKPKVSIITSTYNRGKTYLPKAIRSVLRQSFKDFEHIIVDDCSTDETEKIVEAFADPRIKYIRLPKNSGSDTKPKNTGILASEGKYICYLDDDCSFRRDHVKVLYEFLENHKEIDVAYGDFWIIDESKKDDLGQPGVRMDFDTQFLMIRNFIDTSVVMHRREAVFDVGGWDETLPKFVDWNLWTRMTKAGKRFKRIPLIITDYVAHENTKSNKVKTKMYFHGGIGQYVFEPTFDPTGCKIFLPYLGEKKTELEPKVAVFTLTYDRLDYTKRMIKSLRSSTEYPFDWFVVDNGSTDGTVAWLKTQDAKVIYNKENKGISKASNQAIDEIKKGDYQIIIKVDNDCEFMTKGVIEYIVDFWKRNHMIYVSPYPEGLVHNPGGAPRVGHGFVGDKEWGGDKMIYIEVTEHIGGLFAAIDAKAYDSFRWKDKFLHGNQDREASVEFRRQGYMPCYIPEQRICHMDTTLVQHEVYKDYFERRKSEKMTRVEDL